MKSGATVSEAKALLKSEDKKRQMRKTIPRAWRELCEEPDELLLDLLADRVESICGHKPDPDSLAIFFRDQCKPRDIEHPPNEKKPTKHIEKDNARPGRRIPTGYTSTRPIAYRFKGERREVSTFRDILLGLCERLFREHYSELERVLALRGRKRPYFARDYQDCQRMFAPREIKGSGIYAETNLNANNVIKMCCDVLEKLGYSREDLEVEVEEQ